MHILSNWQYFLFFASGLFALGFLALAIFDMGFFAAFLEVGFFGFLSCFLGSWLLGCLLGSGLLGCLLGSGFLAVFLAFLAAFLALAFFGIFLGDLLIAGLLVASFASFLGTTYLKHDDWNTSPPLIFSRNIERCDVKRVSFL